MSCVRYTGELFRENTEKTHIAHTQTHAVSQSVIFAFSAKIDKMLPRMFYILTEAQNTRKQNSQSNRKMLFYWQKVVWLRLLLLSVRSSSGTDRSGFQFQNDILRSIPSTQCVCNKYNYRIGI